MNEYTLIALSVLLITSVLASKLSDRFGVPALLIFLILGMVLGSDGLGGINFDDPALAQSVGVVALVLILFSGGLDTDWQTVRPVFKHGLWLSTLGVFMTAVVVGGCAHLFLGLSPLEGLLLGAIVSSTDAAAVFSILRSKGVNLKGQLRPLLELESGSNDPMAIFLTIGLIQLLTEPGSSLATLLLLFVGQFFIGGLVGYGMGRGFVLLVNRIKLGYEGLYPVLTLGLMLFTYGFATAIGGNGFLAVYLAALVAGSSDFIHKRSLLRFHDGLAWLMQITMFLTLGLLVFPTRLLPIVGSGLLIAGCLIFVARPLAVFLTLLPTRFSWREKAYLSWVGLRGAVPIVLATYPLLAGLPQADLIFNVIFFVVLTSVLLQGVTVSRMAHWFQVAAPMPRRPVYPLEYNPVSGMQGGLKEVIIPIDSHLVGRTIVEIGFPRDFLIILIARGDKFVIPSGGTVLEGDDHLLALADAAALAQAEAKITAHYESK
ncbi:MAG: potassium/proton antiporter [Anaerolineae bacterium]|nr:potassium/proton antiporter [Anaerolineae bacterium]